MSRFLALLAVLTVQACVSPQGGNAASGTEAPASAGKLDIAFKDSGAASPGATDKLRARTVLVQSEAEVRRLLPHLPERITVDVEFVDWDLSLVGGASGRADMPGFVTFYVSSAYDGGIEAAARDGLRNTIFHEFHHLARGWTIRNNAFGPGIDIAAINEGLADVFAETYSGYQSAALDYPAEAAEWAEEILNLPQRANYNEWMNQHSDGRFAVGYRTGRYVVHQAMEKSGMSILELSALSVGDIWRLAGFEYDKP